MSADKKRIKCPVCSERLLPDKGPDEIPFHIRKGTIVKCPGTGERPA